ncbi:hypothetical protein CW751_02805 [Brumimicrobium salinarum]|uniref:Uncharacterized protein n=1 Tax=Brumimicrobium salinarum TaxID=2058658 RepID=A0A2I0R6T0_9FLAO|nr:hypothetical protein [Brumimicrobium salinarum]PKR82277.1 hypothetical protein CW751_02805 [Brumimicrobium salinarum]
MKIFKFIFAFLQAAFLMFGFVAIAVIIYLEGKSAIHFIGIVVVLLVGFIVSRFLFNLMRRRGVLAVMTGTNASYDVDDLNPSSASGVLKLDPIALVKLFQEHKIKFPQDTSISIWGDWQGRKLDERHQISSIAYDKKNNLLIILFKDKCLIKIRKPTLILLASSYLKIVKAKEIVWEISNKSSSIHTYSYLNTGKKIKTQSNTNWKPHKMDIGIGMHALYLQG